MNSAPTHSVFVGYLLWIFGFTGSHRFYFGKPVSGTVWFCTFGLFGIGWFLDAFLMSSLSRDAAGSYRRGQYDYTIAWALLTFLGVFGLHRFYLGKVATGILYLCTLGFFGIGVIFDFWTLNGKIDDANRQAEGRAKNY
ncbi:MAG: TM2 domain-containing protein [Silvanigrellales bacterium]|jgi:TM2 domain-containing membrane protein YozV|nr:TM2 domain-containing protein [Silvanigrellales bacterium]